MAQKVWRDSLEMVKFCLPSKNESLSSRPTDYEDDSCQFGPEINERPAIFFSKPKNDQKLSKRVDFSKFPCQVCGCSSTGKHFGVISCEGCKAFFWRSMNGTYRLDYYCKKQKDRAKSVNGNEFEGGELCDPSSNCRQCRLCRCQAAGMSLSDGLVVGRMRLETRKELDSAMKKLADDKAILNERRLRRYRNNASKSKSKETEEEPSHHQLGSTSSGSGPGPSNEPSHSHVNSEGPSSAPWSSNNGGSGSTPSFSVLPMLEPSPPFSSSDQSRLSMCQTAFVSIPSFIPYPDRESNFNLEVALTPSPAFNDILANGSDEASFWLIEQTVQASARLADISNVAVIYTSSMTGTDMVIERGRSFDTYLKSISEFFTFLPGSSQVSISDRVILFTHAFFPVLIAQLSLSFDVDAQIPNHLSLDRNGTWQMVSNQNPWHFLIERYLCEAGNKLTRSLLSLEEFALFCALLFFNTAVQSVGNGEAIRSIRARYELALFHYASRHFESDAFEMRLGQFYALLSFFRNATSVFQCDIRGLPVHCPRYAQACSPLFKDFRMQFISKLQL